MNKLSLIFIAGALAVSIGLVFAQKQLNLDVPAQGHSMEDMNMSGHAMRTEESPSEQTVVP